MSGRAITLFLAVLVALVARGAVADTGRLLGTRTTHYPDWFKESFLELSEDVSEAAAQGRRVMLLYYQDDCPYCNALVERNLAQKRIEQKLREHFDVIALNLRGDREVLAVDGTAYTEKRLARALDVQFTPTLLFLDQSGKVILRLDGYLPPEQFELSLDYLIERRETQQSFRDFAAARNPPPSSGTLNAEDFFASPPHDLRSAQGKPLAIFFEQRRCPDCDSLHADVLGLDETRALIGDFHCVQLDMWSDTPLVLRDGRRLAAREWASELDLHYAPTIVLFDPEGREVIRADSVLGAFHAQSLLEYVASGRYRNQPDFQRYLTERANAMRARGVDVDIW